MKVYHMSQSLKLGDILKPDHDETAELCQPFIQALERSEDCFYGMILNGKYLYVLLRKFRMWEWSDYAKWSTEGAFEFIRKTEFPDCYSRLKSNYFYDNLSNCKKLYEYDWGSASEEEQQKVHLFEIQLEDDHPAYVDMNIFDEAYEAMLQNQDIEKVLSCARRYYSGEQTRTPVLEILSDKPAKAVEDLTACIR